MCCSWNQYSRFSLLVDVAKSGGLGCRYCTVYVFCLNFGVSLSSGVLDTSTILHSKLFNFWKHEAERRKNMFTLPKKRCQRAIDASSHRGGANSKSEGDVLLDKIRELFLNGMGIKWSEIQVNIFNVFVDACLPKIFGNTWNEHKVRVLLGRGLKRLWQEVLINMARRNGKTFVTAGTSAAILLCVPDISIAVFSTGERTARMLMDVVRDMIKNAWSTGTVVKRTEYTIIQSNKEILLLEGPDGTKRLLGCYPGSVRVRLFSLSLKCAFEESQKVNHGSKSMNVALNECLVGGTIVKIRRFHLWAFNHVVYPG